MKANLIRTGLTALCGLLLPALLTAEEPTMVQSATFKDKKIVAQRDGKPLEPTNAVALPGKIIVETNGLFTVNSGKERELKEGQTITADGMLLSADGSIGPVYDHLTVKNGRTVIIKDGEAAPLSREFALPDGSRAMPDGTVRNRAGRLSRMIDGQILKLDGTPVPAVDTAMLRGGKVYVHKDGAPYELHATQSMAMSDGSKVKGDGTLIKPDGTTVRLKDGELVKLPGVLAPRR